MGGCIFLFQNIVLHSQSQLFKEVEAIKEINLHPLYFHTNYDFLWVNNLKENTYEESLNTFKTIALEHGLNVNRYNFKTHYKYFNAYPPEKKDAILSSMYLRLFNDLATGVFPSFELNQELTCQNKQVNIYALLVEAIYKKQLVELAEFLSPQIDIYKQLKMRLNQKNHFYAPEFHNKIKANMERLRWMSKHEKDALFLLVNIPSFQLFIYKNNQAIDTFRVVVGKPENSTPTFECAITKIIYNPWWHIPNSIAKNEIIPAIKKDSNYLKINHIVLKNSWRVSDTSSVNLESNYWDTLNTSNFRYKFSQAPHEKNPLGKVKFLFPNQHDVYLHDTNAKHLFSKNYRAYSHGCIRVENAEELAEVLLHHQKKQVKEDPWAPSDALQKVRSLERTVPIHIFYLTTSWDSKQALLFDDIYNKDLKLIERIQNIKPGRSICTD